MIAMAYGPLAFDAGPKQRVANAHLFGKKHTALVALHILELESFSPHYAS